MATIEKNKTTTSTYNHEDIKVRRVNFNFEKKNPRFYYKNNPFSTHFINALHIVFPTGERFFVNATLKHKNKIEDEKLKKQVKNFCGQEGIHSSMHERFWNILKENGNFGYDAKNDKYEDMIVVGIIDPKKVVRVALEDAASVSGLMSTTECMIVDKK